MFIVMNRFKIKKESETKFVEIWRSRDSYLNEMQGFIRFNLLKGKTEADYTLYSSFTEWESKAHFDVWLKSEQFKKAHQNANSPSNSDIYLEAPQFECFEAVL